MKINLKATNVFERNYKSDKRIVVNQGGTGCFHGYQLVSCKEGFKKIKDIVVGDIVKSSSGFNRVINTFKYKNKKNTVKVTLKNGQEIIATDDHKFWYQGGWVSLKDMIKLSNARRVEKNTRIPE